MLSTLRLERGVDSVAPLLHKVLLVPTLMLVAEARSSVIWGTIDAVAPLY